MVLTLLRTLKHLRPRQVMYRARYRIPFATGGGPLALRWSPSPPRIRRERNAPARMLAGPGRIRINNEERHFPCGWEPAGARRLWAYNLHYMGWLFELEAGREEWILSWIRENPRARGGTGWEPYPLSLRLFNWCKHYGHSGSAPDPAVLASMGEQAAALLGRLEFHLDGNHLLENLLALGFVSAWLDMEDPASARAAARIGRLLDRELADQFLEDGGHYELSPMYHSILLERILDLLNCLPRRGGPMAPALDRMERIASKAVPWLEAMTVGRDFSLFNDAAYDMAPRAEDLISFGHALLGTSPRAAAPLLSLPASGYHRAEAGPFTLIFDAGRLAPDHQMGHAQCDTLSFCLWHHGLPVFTHPGNYEYLPGPMREYCRSTASHNTVTVDGREQAELWASHRIGRRGYPVDVSASAGPASGAVLLGAGHTGFAGLPGAPIHRREIRLEAGGIIIRDAVASSRPHAARAHFLLHPDCSLEAVAGGYDILHPGGMLAFRSAAPMVPAEGWHCPEFGIRRKAPALFADFTGGAEFRIGPADHAPGGPRP